MQKKLCSSQWVANEDVLYVGRYVIDDTPTHDAHYDDYIDELRLWRKTLDADEIRQNYNTSVLPTTDPNFGKMATRSPARLSN